MIVSISRHRKVSNERGASAVEFALVAPLLFLLLFGIIEFGFIFNRWITITHAAREGVRLMSVGVPANDALYPNGDAQTRAERAAPLLTSSDDNPPGDNEVTCIGSEPAAGEVQMTCYANYHLALYVFQSTVDLDSTARMTRE